jgi:WD40 repeat protein
MAWGWLDLAIHLWDPATGKQVRKLDVGQEGSAKALAFSPKGNILATGMSGGSILFWEVGTGKRTGQLDTYKRSVVALLYSPDGKLLVSRGGDGSIFLWDLAAQKPRWRVEGAPLSSPLVCLPDGKIIASATGTGVGLWEVATGKELQRFPKMPLATDWALAISPDGKKLAVAGGSFNVGLWHMTSGDELGRFEGHKGYVGSLAFSPDGKKLASGSLDTSVLRDVENLPPKRGDK